MDNVQLFREFISNLFKKGGKKSSSANLKSIYNEDTFLKDYNAAWQGTRYDTPEWRTFWTKLAKRESGFKPLVINKIGAKGYFLLMPFNRSSTWKDNLLQFDEADKLIRKMESRFTLADYAKAAKLGLSKQALLAGAWLGGVGGVRAALNGETRADMNGTTVMSRMKDFNNLKVNTKSNFIETPNNSSSTYNPIELYLNTPIKNSVLLNDITTNAIDNTNTIDNTNNTNNTDNDDLFLNDNFQYTLSPFLDIVLNNIKLLNINNQFQNTNNLFLDSNNLSTSVIDNYNRLLTILNLASPYLNANQTNLFYDGGETNTPTTNLLEIVVEAKAPEIKSFADLLKRINNLRTNLYDALTHNEISLLDYDKAIIGLNNAEQTYYNNGIRAARSAAVPFLAPLVLAPVAPIIADGLGALGTTAKSLVSGYKGWLTANPIASALLNNGVTSYFGTEGALGLYNNRLAINESLDNLKYGTPLLEDIAVLGEAALNTTMVAPVAKTTYNAAKDIGKSIISTADKTTRALFPSYDLYRIIGENTPNIERLNPVIRTRLGDVEIDNPQLYYRHGEGIASDFINTGAVKTLPNTHFEYPMFNKGEMWAPIRMKGNPKFTYNRDWRGTHKQDLLVTNSENMWPADVDSLPVLLGDEWLLDEATNAVKHPRVPYPINDLNPNNTTAYTWEPNYGYRKQIINDTLPLTLDYSSIKPLIPDDLIPLIAKQRWNNEGFNLDYSNIPIFDPNNSESRDALQLYINSLTDKLLEAAGYPKGNTGKIFLYNHFLQRDKNPAAAFNIGISMPKNLLLNEEFPNTIFHHEAGHYIYKPETPINHHFNIGTLNDEYFNLLNNDEIAKRIELVLNANGIIDKTNLTGNLLQQYFSNYLLNKGLDNSINLLSTYINNNKLWDKIALWAKSSKNVRSILPLTVGSSALGIPTILNLNSNQLALGGNLFATGGPLSLRLSAISNWIMELKLKQLFSKLSEKKPRNAQTDRKRHNTSPTASRSENIENLIYGFLPKDRNFYDVPFIPDKSILINGYTTSTNALDSLAKYAGIHNRTLQVSENPIKAKSKTKTRPVTKEEALGLSLRETKGGALPYTNDSGTSGDKEAKRAFYNANVFTAFLDIPATALVNNYHYNKTSQTVPPLLDAFLYYAQGDYNRGDTNHTADVKAAGAEAFKNPQVQRWWNNEGKYWFNGVYLNAGDDGGEHSMLQGELLNIGTQPVKLKANGGNLFYDGGDEEEDIKSLIASLWPATSKINYKLKPQEGFSLFVDKNGNPRGTIETITPNQVAVRWSPVYAKMGIPASERPLLEEANRVDCRDYDKEGNPIGEILMGKNYVTTNQPGLNTIVYNPQYTKIEDIKQDLLHVMHDDPEYEKLYDIYMTAALNDMDFLYHDFSEGDLRAVEAMMNGAFSRPTNGNLERGLDADATLQALLDGYLREQFYPGTPEERMAAGYTGVPYAIKNPSLLNAINNIRGYLEKKALGGPLYNLQNPIEGFQGGRQLPLVRQ